MANRNQNQNPGAQTDIQKVRQQNQAAAQGQRAEFAAETNAQKVRQQNAQAEAKKNQNQQ